MVIFRDPREDDWPGILNIANASVAAVEGAGTQEEWLENRKTFTGNGIQHHFVCTDAGQLLGYGSAENASDAQADSYRLFVVTQPETLHSIGEAIFDELVRILPKFRAQRSWFVEYANDSSLTGFLKDHGYEESRRFKLDSGVEAAVFERERDSVT